MASNENVLPFQRSTGGSALRMKYTATSTAADAADSVEPAPNPQPIPIPSAPSRVIPIMDLGGSELRLRTPIYVTVEESDGAIVALSYDLEIGEQGETEFEALDNFRAAVRELFVALKEMDAEAPPHLARKLAFLESLAL